MQDRYKWTAKVSAQNSLTIKSSPSHGENRYDPIGPQAFRIGDIVEMQLSIVVVPMKGEKCKMVNVLRALTLLEARPRQVSKL